MGAAAQPDIPASAGGEDRVTRSRRVFTAFAPERLIFRRQPGSSSSPVAGVAAPDFAARGRCGEILRPLPPDSFPGGGS